VPKRRVVWQTGIGACSSGEQVVVVEIDIFPQIQLESAIHRLVKRGKLRQHQSLLNRQV